MDHLIDDLKGCSNGFQNRIFFRFEPVSYFIVFIYMILFEKDYKFLHARIKR